MPLLNDHSIETVLFDWGDTLMVDFPGLSGKMCDWETVATVEGAAETLARLAKSKSCYVATGAEQSTPEEIKQAFQRVNLDSYIRDYFCQANLGIPKGTAEFYLKILEQLKCGPELVAMVGDNLEKDIYPAKSLGIKTFWLTKTDPGICPEGTSVIKDLSELCE